MRRALLCLLLALLVPAGGAHAAPLPSCPGVGPVQALTADTTFLESIGFDEAGNLLYSRLFTGEIRLLPREGATPRTVARVILPGGIAPLPGGDVVVASGNVLGVLLPGGAKVVRLTPATGATRTIARRMVAANGLVRRGDGTIFTSDPPTGTIDRVEPGGRVARAWLRNSGGPNGLALSADEQTLYANFPLNRRVVAIDIATKAIRTIYRVPADRGAATLDGLAIDPAGNLYAAIGVLGQVWRIGQDGSACVLARDLGSATAVGLSGATPGFSPSSVYVTTRRGVLAVRDAVPPPAEGPAAAG